MKISMDWKGGMKFTGTSRFGHEISTDGSKKAGGSEDGYQPLELLLFGLAGCTGIDVVKIAQKLKQEITDFKVTIEAEQKEEHPRVITKAHIEYAFSGKDLKPEILEQAVDLSETRYCSVGTTLSGVTKITHSVKIKEG